MFVLHGSWLLGQTAQYSAVESACINEVVEFQNNSTNALSYEWDFCLSDFTDGDRTINTLLSIPSLSNVYGNWIGEDNGNWYGFIISNGTDNLFRLDYGTDPSSIPLVIDLGNPEDDMGTGLFDDPGRMDVFNFDGNWYGVVGFTGSGGEITLLDFGSSLANTPVASSLGNFSLNRIWDVKLAIQNGDIILIMAYLDGNRIYRANYGDSFENTPTTVFTSITGMLNPVGIDVVNYVNDWHVIATRLSSTEVYHYNFGPDLMTDGSLSNTFTLSLSNPNAITLLREGDQFIGSVSNANAGGISMINFKDLSVGLTPDEEVITSVERTRAVHGFRYNGSTIFSIVNNNLEVLSIEYEKNCLQEFSYSTEINPSLTFQAAGEYPVELRAITNDSVSIYTDTLTILSQTAPSISYTSDNVCINSSIIFTPTNPGLTSYSWDFNGDGIEDSDLENPEVRYDTLGGIGTYTVRLDVNDGTCNNFFEEEITIYDPPPAPTYTYSSARTCINADFTFTNTTSDGAYVGPLEYLWEFIDEPSGTVVATATTKDAVYAFETEGQKTVRLTSSIPGCSELTEQTLMITPGPTANFSATSVCQNEAMQFTNTSLDATSYSWDFGDGFMSTATNPSHIFSGAGNYFVTLTATDDEGCDDSEIIEVSVSDSPQINFDFDVPCTSADGIQFFDLSTVENADLVSWTWYVDDEEVSTQQSPHIVFESTGIKNVRLDVQSSNGCESSYSEDIEVLTSPEPDFNVSVGCQGEISVFADNTVTSGNPIVSWLWTVEGTNYGTQDINHVFTEAGLFDVTLEVTGQNFCSETITKTIEIIELPSIGFSVDGECDNQLIRAQDQSSASTDPVVSRRWMLDGLNVGSGSQLLLESLANDTYELALELETASGCVISAAQTLEINIAPESSFTSSRTYGIPGDQLSFSNSSTGAVSYQWLLNGSAISTDAESQNISFTEVGIHIVSLVAQNSLGCNDTTSQEILIAIPEVDISIGSFELVRENNTGKIFLEVQNFSNLPIEITEAQIVLENQFTVTEQILKFIDVGESSLVSLNVGIPLNISEPSYFCVKLTSQYVDFPDVNQINNEKCITIKSLIRVEDPFPNPVTDQFRLKVILPEEDVAFLRLLNSAGKIHSENHFNANEGLNNFFVDMSTLDPGIYFVSVEVGGNTFRRKVIKL